MIFRSIPHLQQLGNLSGNERFLFNFRYNNLDYRCLYFCRSNNFLVSARGLEIGWLFSLEENGYTKPYIPKDIYLRLKESLPLIDGKRATTPLFEYLDDHCTRIALRDIERATREDIYENLRFTRTNDKRYGKYGDNPFYGGIKRNPGIKGMGDGNYEKTLDKFGVAVADFLRENRISTVWYKEPRTASLDFLNPVAFLNGVRNRYNIPNEALINN